MLDVDQPNLRRVEACKEADQDHRPVPKARRAIELAGVHHAEHLVVLDKMLSPGTIGGVPSSVRLELTVEQRRIDERRGVAGTGRFLVPATTSIPPSSAASWRWSTASRDSRRGRADSVSRRVGERFRVPNLDATERSVRQVRVRHAHRHDASFPAGLRPMAWVPSADRVRGPAAYDPLESAGRVEITP